MNVADPPPCCPVVQTTNNRRGIDKSQFQTDVSLTISSQPPSTDDFNSQLRSVLDGHGPDTCHKVTQHKSIPWYSPVALRLCALRMERHWVEHQWFIWYKVTVHKQS